MHPASQTKSLQVSGDCERPIKQQLSDCQAGADARSGERRGEARGIAAALQRYMAEVHAPALLRPSVQAAVLAVFLGVFLLSLAALPRLSKCALSPSRAPRWACTLRG